MSLSIIICQPGFETFLSDELKTKLASLRMKDQLRNLEIEIDDGFILVNLDYQFFRHPEFTKPLIFERQRLIEVGFPDFHAGRDVAEEMPEIVIKRLRFVKEPVTIHCFSLNVQSKRSPFIKRFLTMFEDLGGIRKALPSLKLIDWQDFRRAAPKSGRVLQVFLSGDQRVWMCLNRQIDLPSLWPGGACRMKMDRRSPSRSYLKMEEALDFLDINPSYGERVIDLGASPGGWTFSFLKRGCRVLAIDNGPLKIEDPTFSGGSLEHVKAGGITYKPKRPWHEIQWLVSDMLIAPGTLIGFFKHWLHGPEIQRFIVNVKLPQKQPLEAIEAVEAYLNQQTNIQFWIRHLCSDRREVTVIGRFQPSQQKRVKLKKPSGPPPTRDRRKGAKWNH